MGGFDDKHYVPILKGRCGEYRALREMGDARTGFTPMIDVPPFDWDFEKNENKKSVDEHLKRLPGAIAECWGAGRPIYLDLYMIQDVDRTEGGQHPLEAVFGRLRDLSHRKKLQPDAIRAIPVTGLNRAAAFQEAVGRIIARDHRGACLRLESRDFDDGDKLEEDIHDLLKYLQLPASEADLVLDLKDVPSSASTTVHAVRGMVSQLPLLRNWRSFALAASAFPTPLPPMTPYKPHVLPRAEWTVWQTVIKGKGKLARRPAFADYGIRAPHYAEADVDPKMLGPSSAPNLRYTHAENWIVLKGRSRKKHGLGQFNDLCKIMVEENEFCGAPFSWGDFMIDACARGSAGPGNSSTWVAIGTSHHIAYVKHQLANLSAS